MTENKVLVAGASGVVGLAAVQHFASLPGWEVVGLSRRPPLPVEGATFVSVDLADAEQARGAVEASLTDVTHLVYAALYEKPGLFAGWYEQDQMERNLVMFRNLLDPLDELAAGLTHVTLLQGTKAYGAHVGPIDVPAREDRPRHQHANFYWLQEDHMRARQEGRPWDWTIMRPQIIFGEALGSNMNAVPALGVYAALLREQGSPLHWPGGQVPFVSEAVDASLLAGAIAWAATTPRCRHEIYNVTNGDVFSMRASWPAIADAFGMEVGDDVPMSLAEALPPREGEWADVVARYGLRAPASLDAFVGQSFLYADMLLGRTLSAAPPLALLSTIKIRKHGFGDCVDTDEMFQRLIRSLQDQKLLPPV